MTGARERLACIPSGQLMVGAIVAGMLVSATTTLLGSQTVSDGVIAVFAAAAGALWLWRVMSRNGLNRGPWRLIAWGYASWGVAETMRFGYELFHAGSVPQPSLVDPFYILGYILLSIGVIKLVIGRSRGTARSSAIDALALAVALGTVLVQLEVIAPGVLEGRLNAAHVLACLYAVLDVPLLGGIAWLVVSPGQRGISMTIMAGAFSAMFIADVSYATGELYHPVGVGVSNFVYPVAYLLAGVAAVHPATLRLADPMRSPERSETHAVRLVFLAAALTVPAMVELLAPVLGLPQLGIAADLVTIAVGAVIVVRMASLLHEADDARGRAHIANSTLLHQATRDHLTGLYNRAWLMEYLDRLIAGECGDGQFAVLYLDLDGFKLINDDLGHHAGDEVLRLTAARMLHAVRPGDRVVRLGGDEFVVVCPPDASSRDTESLAARLVAVLGARFHIGEHDVHITASIGVLTAMTGSGLSAIDLLRNADTALYRAKEAHGTWRVFNAGMRATTENRLEILTQLRTVIRNDQLQVVYQPLVDLATERVEGIEALVRLTMPDGREIPPRVFVGIAESTGAARVLDAAVMARALNDLHWLDEHCGDRVDIAVNLSASEVTQPGLVSMVRRALASAQVEPSRLRVEVTETAVVTDLEAASAQLSDLRELGVRIEIDDFGTGYSSMAYLHSLPIDGIKVDRSFVQGTFMDANHALITEGMIRMGKALGLRLVGEGIEEPKQAARLAALGCDVGQGYLFGRPMPREEILEYLLRGQASAVGGSEDVWGRDGEDAGVGEVGLSVVEPLIAAQVAKRRDDASRLDHEFKEMSLDRLIGPPTVLHDPLIANGDDPAAASPDLNGVGNARRGADYS